MHWGNSRFGNSLGDHETVRRLRFLTASRAQNKEELPVSLFRQAPLWQAPKDTHWSVQLLLSPWTWLVLLLLGLLYLFPPISSLPKLGPEAIVLKAMNSEDMQLAVKNALQRSGAGAMQTEGLIMGADGSDLTKEEAVTRILATFEDVTADSQMFSENLYKAGNYPNYRNARGECDWKERQFSERDFFTYKHYRSVSDWERRKHAKRNSWCQAQQYTFSRGGRNQYRHQLPDHGVKMCDVVSSVNKGEKWSIIRLGPHYSFGGMDMHEVWLYDAMPKLRELLGTHSVIWITGFFAGPVMEDGYPLANPPIAINNIRLFESEGFPMRFPNQNAFIQVNADTQYPTDEGGTFPFSADLLKGHALPVTQAVGLHYEVSDIRREGSGNLNFYVEIAIRYSLERPLRPTALIQTSMPFPVVGAADMRRYVEEFSHFIPAHTSSVVWYTGTMAYPGKLLHGSAHSSSRWLDSLYIFTGSPEMIGLNQYGYEIDYAGQNFFRPEDHGIDLEDVKLRVLASSLQTGAKLRCASTGRIEFYKILEGSEEEVMGIDTKAPYDRAPATTCFGDWNWIEGEQWTVVAFHKPACGNGCANFKGPGGGKHDIPVHSTFRGLFAHAVIPITHHTIFGAERPEDMLVADKSLDLVTSFQAAYTVSKRFPPRVAHANVVGGLHYLAPIGNTLRNVLIDEMCTK